MSRWASGLIALFLALSMWASCSTVAVVTHGGLRVMAFLKAEGATLHDSGTSSLSAWIGWVELTPDVNQSFSLNWGIGGERPERTPSLPNWSELSSSLVRTTVDNLVSYHDYFGSFCTFTVQMHAGPEQMLTEDLLLKMNTGSLSQLSYRERFAFYCTLARMDYTRALKSRITHLGGPIVAPDLVLWKLLRFAWAPVLALFPAAVAGIGVVLWSTACLSGAVWFGIRMSGWKRRASNA